MIQLKLKLNSKKPTTVYAVNGKSYLLNPGSNVLNLEYEDYLSLAKALGIKPVDNKKNENKALDKEEKKSEVKNIQKEEAPAEPEKVEDQEPEFKESEADPDKVEAPKENEASENKNENEQVKELASEEIDYSTWSLKQLKAKYKEITGENCKLKKDDVISFLQEHQSNA